MFSQCENPPHGCRLLELGAGMGVCGIYGAALGLDVTITDNSDLLIDLARKNAMLNTHLFNRMPEVQLLDWEGELPDNMEPFQLVVASGKP